MIDNFRFLSGPTGADVRLEIILHTMLLNEISFTFSCCRRPEGESYLDPSESYPAKGLAHSSKIM